MRCNVGINNRGDLSEFLKARRAGLTPGDVGLPPGQRRRTTGLRREEVAVLADVSVSWYTWLEQGRPIKASAEVLDALARALRLDAVERDHLFALAGHPQRVPIRPGSTAASPAVRRLLDALAPAPAYLLGARWDLIAWNAPFALLFPAVLELDVEDRNLVWIVFANADARALIGDWEHEARRVLSQFRAEIVPWRDDPAVVRLVARLQEASDEFAAVVATPRRRRFRDAPARVPPSRRRSARVRDPATRAGRRARPADGGAPTDSGRRQCGAPVRVRDAALSAAGGRWQAPEPVRTCVRVC